MKHALLNSFAMVPSLNRPRFPPTDLDGHLEYFLAKSANLTGSFPISFFMASNASFALSLCSSRSMCDASHHDVAEKMRYTLNSPKPMANNVTGLMGRVLPKGSGVSLTYQTLACSRSCLDVMDNDKALADARRRQYNNEEMFGNGECRIIMVDGLCVIRGTSCSCCWGSVCENHPREILLMILLMILVESRLYQCLGTDKKFVTWPSTED